LSQSTISAIAGGNMTTNITIRGLLSPFCHVAWTAIAAGALWRVKGGRPFSPAMLADSTFLRAFIIPVVLHMIWNAGFIPSVFYLKQVILGLIGWFILFGIVQQGLKQVKSAQLEQAREELSRTQSAITAVTGSHMIPRPAPAR
jgi:protease PrsW